MHFTAQAYAVTGVTRDNVGAALAGCVVALYRAGSLELVAQGMSNGAGAYALPAPNNAGLFYVASFYPDGSLAGITRPILEATAVAIPVI